MEWCLIRTVSAYQSLVAKVDPRVGNFKVNRGGAVQSFRLLKSVFGTKGTMCSQSREGQK